MDEELEVTGRGSGHARADFVIWRTAKDKADSKSPLIIVECKSDNVTIKPDDDVYLLGLWFTGHRCWDTLALPSGVVD